MEPDVDLDPETDDLPLRANTSHILVRHYVLDLTVHFHRRVIGGSVVLFLEPGPGAVSGPGNEAGSEDGDGDEDGDGSADGGRDKSGPATGPRLRIVDRGRTEAGTGPKADDVNAGEAGVGPSAGAGPEVETGLGHGDDGPGDRPGVGAAAGTEKGLEKTTPRMEEGFGARDGAASGDEPLLTHASWERSGDGDFTLVLDCCDLAVSKVEEVDVTSVPAMSRLLEEDTAEGLRGNPTSQSAALIQKLVSLPSGQWRQQHQLYSQCSCAPGPQGGGALRFHTDRWSLQVRKRGARTPQDFPRAVRVCYETRPEGGSVRWTKDQDNRVCVYTAGSPINNRALFPCQEPPVAMSTWQATVRAPGECVVLMSGENQATPAQDEQTGLSIWDYYVTMTMPASTFTLAVGHWRQATAELPSATESGPRSRVEGGDPGQAGAAVGAWPGSESEAGSSTSEVVKGCTVQTARGDLTGSDSAPCYSCLGDEWHSVTDCPGTADDSIPCSHDDYPCRFTERSAWSQRLVPHRVFAPVCLLQEAQAGVLSLLPRCLAAAHAVLGVHPFPRLDVLIVPAGFSSLGMARLCHELAHSWFGLAIGARDWTEEWISEGFATYLEDVIWARAQQLTPAEAEEQSDLKALLRWRRLSDELQNSEEELQILRPNMENTGQVSESGSSMVKHALNPDKSFMQVHYLKGYFLLRFLAGQVGQQQFIRFFRLFVKKYHGQLILSQDFLRMLLDTFPDMARQGLTLSTIDADWLDGPGIPKWLFEGSVEWTQAHLVEQVKAEVVKWILPSQKQGMRKGRKRRKREEPKVNHREVTSDQLVLLLELLLEEAELSVTSLRTLQRTYNLRDQDAEVRHRWCELVVKHGYSQAYGDVEHFLVHDQAMGVYLYGELMVQEDAEQQALARHCLSLVQEEMDRPSRRVAEEMVL